MPPLLNLRRSLILGLMLLGPALSQQFAPHIGYVYPAGGRRGTSFVVTIGGQFLDGASRMIASGGGIQGDVGEHTKPMTQAQFARLREELRQLLEKKPAGYEKTAAEIRMKLAAFIRRPANPAIAETVAVRVTLAPDAGLGERELRLLTRTGLTNPITFLVGQLPEFSKAPAKVSADLPAGQAFRLRNQPRGIAPPASLGIELPTVVNGQIAPGGVDRFRFRARKGMQLLAAARAQSLIPYISDAVPGWFQAVVALYGPNGQEVAYADDFRFHPDPVLSYAVPDEGEYTLEVRDSIYRGREDFVYRLAVGELPFITGIFPLGAKSGTKATLELAGWNLPSPEFTHDAKSRPQGVYPLFVRSGEWLSNSVPFAVDALPERLEQEPDDFVRNAMKVKLPVIVNGRVHQPGDRDVFRFDGRAGEEIVAEVVARRLDSPLDSILELTDARGRCIAANDDHEDRGAALITHHADSAIRATLPAKGPYYLHLADTQRKGGSEYAYRLRIGVPQPGFELRLVPSSINVRAGANIPITVHALRRDAFGGEIALALKDAPSGWTLSGGWIPANQDKVRLTLAAPPVPSAEPVAIKLEGHATIRGKEVRRLAVPAEDMMQAFAYRHLVPAQECLAQVVGAARRGPASSPKLDAARPVKIPSGGSAEVRIDVPRGRLPQQVQLALNEPPEGIFIQQVIPARDGLAILLRTDASKVKPGLQGNLIVDAFSGGSAGRSGPQTNTRRVPLGTLPAIPFEVVRANEIRR